MAAGELTRGSADEAGRYLARAARGLEGGEGPVRVPAERRGRMQIFLAIVRLPPAPQRGDPPAPPEEAQRLPAATDDPAPRQPGAGAPLRAEAEPAAGVLGRYARGLLELARGGNEETRSALQAAERLAGTRVTPHTLATPMRALMLLARVGMGETGHGEATLAGLD